MAAVARGEAEAFEALWKRFARPVGSFFFRLCFDRNRCDDLVQEVFVRLWRSAGRWRGSGSLAGYVFALALNVWRTERKRNRPRQAEEGELLGETSAVAADPGARAEGAEVRQLLAEALAHLPEEQRLVFVLGQVEELPYRQIAALTGVPVGTVKSRMSAAEEKLRAQLAPLLGMRPQR